MCKQLIWYAHKDDPDGVRFIDYTDSDIPEWAVDVKPYVENEDE